ncbi:hypothetical protein G9A89_014486 [Geosiphon pyriformis]|nr:hypothetical protein G9A89_014486 [Geosiphon pyriformis]
MNFSSEQEDNEFPTLSSLESLPTKDPQVFSLFNTEDPLPLPPIHKISLNSTVVYSGQRFQTYLPKFRSLESKSRIGSKNQKKIIERKRTDSFFRYEVKRKDKGSNNSLSHKN